MVLPVIHNVPGLTKGFEERLSREVVQVGVHSMSDQQRAETNNGPCIQLQRDINHAMISGVSYTV